jgi:hypothetical protein
MHASIAGAVAPSQSLALAVKFLQVMAVMGAVLGAVLAAALH